MHTSLTIHNYSIEHSRGGGGGGSCRMLIGVNPPRVCVYHNMIFRTLKKLVRMTFPNMDVNCPAGLHCTLKYSCLLPVGMN